jgi:hypothetical protein
MTALYYSSLVALFLTLWVYQVPLFACVLIFGFFCVGTVSLSLRARNMIQKKMIEYAEQDSVD